MTARPWALGMWLPIDHEKYDSRKARDGEKNTDLSPLHLLIVRDIGGRLLGANGRKTDWRGGLRRISKLPELLRSFCVSGEHQWEFSLNFCFVLGLG
jgi:hypothetical protein